MASSYDFAEQLLISQRKFAESLLEAMKPLLGAGNGAAKKGATKLHPAGAASPGNLGPPRTLVAGNIEAGSRTFLTS